MRRQTFKYASSVDPIDEERAANADGEGCRCAFPVRAVASATLEGTNRRHDPSGRLTQVGEQLQGAVAELEDLMFESPEAGGRCRAEVHDAIALLMEGLQALGRARVCLDRSRDAKAAMSVHSLVAPLARA